MPFDNFNRADANPVDGSYATAPGCSATRIVGQQVYGTASTDNGTISTGTYNNDQVAQIKIRAISASNSCGILLRSGGSSQYMIKFTSGGNCNGWRYFGGAWDGSAFGTFTVSGGCNAGDIFLAEIVGNKITVFKNGVPVGILNTDGTITSGAPGWYCYNTTSSIDDYKSGNYVFVPSDSNPKKQKYIYYGGPRFTPNGTVTNFATFDDDSDVLAALGCSYGSGRVFLSGFHCEVLSDAGLYTTDTDRAFLKQCIGWVLNNYQPSLPVIVYNETAEIWATSVSGIESVLTALGINYVERTAAQINSSGGLIGSYRGIFMPGGLGVGTSLDSNGRTYILNLINAGGGYVGICSGAYGAASTYVWEGSSGSGIGLFDGTATGSLGEIAGWSSEVLTTITVNSSAISSSSPSGTFNVWRRCPSSRLASASLIQEIVSGIAQNVTAGFWETVAGDMTITISDSSSASDALGIGVVLAIAESGQGSDSFGMGAALALTDAGSGADVVAQLLAQLAVNDAGAGSDAISQLLAQLAVNDSGLGVDALAGIAASLSITDTGTGTDSPSISATFIVTDAGSGSDSLSILQTILVAIADAASANDSLGVSVNLSPVDTGHGADAVALSVNLSVSDAGNAVDSLSVLMDIIKAVADAAQASDAIGPISVNLAVSDSGAGLDLLSALNVVAQVVDYASGLDVVIRIIGAETKTISITFVGKKPAITFSGKQSELQFAGKSAAISFTSHQPEIVFSGGRTAQIAFSSQGGQ